MYKKLQQRKSEGFTIIEVLIVLAIAGLIMVVVFLAVPALQRSGRNNAMNSNVNNIFAGVNNYVANNNGTLPTTISGPAAGVVTIGVAPLNIEKVKVDSSVATVALNPTSQVTAASDVGTVQIFTGKNAICNTTASGLGTAGSASPRSVAVLYVAESGSGHIVKCLE